MRVIFLHDVERVGHEGEVADVADGYARNYLLPRGLAVKASKGALRELEERRSAIERRDQQKRERATSLAQDLAQKTVVVKATVGEGQRLHGQVTALQIAAAVMEQLEIEVDRRDIEIAEPIRLVGDYLISARIYKDVYAELPVSVVPYRLPKDDAEDEDIPEKLAAPAQADADAAEDTIEEEMSQTDSDTEAEPQVEQPATDDTIASEDEAEQAE